MDLSRVAEIAQGVYWVGGSSQHGGLHCNPYLIVDGEEAVLIDPGSALDFEKVYHNVCSLIPLEKIKYVILHHQDPDFCVSVPLFEAKGAHFKIVTHWRTQTLVKYYGIKSEYYIVNDNEYKLTLKSGRVLTFLPTPYLHFPGSITTYDNLTKMLFSSDLFGAFSYEWSLYAGKDYLEKMKAFHEHYMPSNDIIRPVMEMFLGMDISMIAPQHGSVIKDNIPMYIKALRDLECGSFLTPIKKNLVKSGGYMSVCSRIVSRYASIFGREEVIEALQDMDITLDEHLNIIDYNYTGDTLWNLIFEKIYTKKGLPWLIVIEPLMQTLVGEYDITIPKIFETKLKSAEAEVSILSEQNLLLKEINQRLEINLKEAEDRLIRCAVTGLYNQDFFKSYISNEIKSLVMDESKQNPGLIIISLDQIEKIEYRYGSGEADEVYKSCASLMETLKQENELFFRLQNPLFACYMQHTTKEAAMRFAETIRNAIYSSEKFIEKMTASLGVVCLDEIIERDAYSNNPDELLFNTALTRVRLARNMGKNIVCGSSSAQDSHESAGEILLVDSDEINIDILKTSLENLTFSVLIARDGDEAVRLAEKNLPLIIISEVMMPKKDGFLIREKLLSLSETKNIPFIFMSYLKNEDSVKRATSLGVEHYFQKPYMLSEFIGVIRNKIRGERYL